MPLQNITLNWNNIWISKNATVDYVRLVYTRYTPNQNDF